MALCEVLLAMGYKRLNSALLFSLLLANCSHGIADFHVMHLFSKRESVCGLKRNK